MVTLTTQLQIVHCDSPMEVYNYYRARSEATDLVAWGEI